MKDPGRIAERRGGGILSCLEETDKYVWLGQFTHMIVSLWISSPATPNPKRRSLAAGQTAATACRIAEQCSAVNLQMSDKSLQNRVHPQLCLDARDRYEYTNVKKHV